ncbi:MAG TPA: hypothetical protein VMX37_07240 [Acidimicrobiia bacterium]|nr:hypothetical protein [Acidimicrobiia bacterium]
MNRDVEAAMGRATARRALLVGPVLVAVFWLTRGGDGAAAAAIGVAIVAGNFLLSGAVLSLAARHSLAVYHAAAVVGFFVRLGLIMLVMLGVAWIWEFDRLAMAIAVVASYLVLLTWEAVVMLRRGEGR